MSAAKERADVLIIGAGAAGGMMAKTLAEAGLRVVCLDQGPWFPPSEKPHWGSDWEWQRATRWATEVNLRNRPNDYPVDTEFRTYFDVERRRRLDRRLHSGLAEIPAERFSQRGRTRLRARLADQLRGFGALLRRGRRA